MQFNLPCLSISFGAAVKLALKSVTMDVCMKFRKAKSDLDRIAILMALPRLVGEEDFDDAMKELANAITPQFVRLLLDQDPAETSMVAVVILNRLLSVDADVAYLGEVFPSFVAYLEKIEASNLTKDNELCSEIATCWLRLYKYFSTSDESLWFRLGTTLSKLYRTSPTLYMEVVVDIWFRMANEHPCANGSLCPMLCAIQSDVDNHMRFVHIVADTASGLLSSAGGAALHPKCLGVAQSILLSMMRAQLPDNVRLDIVSCIYAIQPPEAPADNIDFLMVAVPFSAIELYYIIDICRGDGQKNLEDYTLPILSCCAQLSLALELRRVAEGQNRHNELWVHTLMRQPIETVAYCMAFLATVDKGDFEQSLLPIVTLIAQYVTDLTGHFDKDQMIPAVRHVLSLLTNFRPRYPYLADMMYSLTVCFVKYNCNVSFDVVIDVILWAVNVLHANSDERTRDGFCQFIEELCANGSLLSPCAEMFEGLFMEKRDDKCLPVALALPSLLLAVHSMPEARELQPKIIEHALECIKSSPLEAEDTQKYHHIIEIALTSITELLRKNGNILQLILAFRSSPLVLQLWQSSVTNRYFDKLDKLISSFTHPIAN